MDEIPSRFTIFNSEWEVIVDNEKCEEEDVYGYTHLDEQRIYISDTHNGVPLKYQKMLEVFCHELVHVCLDGIQEHKLNDDERFVDLFGKVLAQFLDSHSG